MTSLSKRLPKYYEGMRQTVKRYGVFEIDGKVKDCAQAGTEANGRRRIAFWRKYYLLPLIS